ncbi:MAG: RDD family protein [Clostridia bacterium]|nr:RDD family protein [Clostridia bacterium]
MNINCKRLLAAFIDFLFMCYIASVTVLILTFGKMEQDYESMCISLVVVFLYALIKDIVFKDASIGKKVMKIMLVPADGKNISFIKHIKRNLTIVLAPLELFLIWSDNRRIGDIWAKTAVVESYNEKW